LQELDTLFLMNGALAQLARALDWQSRGSRSLYICKDFD